MMIALVLLLAQVDLKDHDLCVVAKSLVRAAPSTFESVRGAEKKDSGKSISWTSPVKVPQATACRVIEYKDGSKPFYFCGLHATSCRLTEKKFEQLAQELDSCFGAGKASDDGKKRQSRYAGAKDIIVRLAFKRAKDCELSFYVEPY